MFLHTSESFNSIITYAAHWGTLTGALDCIRAHWLVFIMYWLYYGVNMLTVFVKSRLNGYLMLCIALVGLPVYDLIWWYVLLPTGVSRLVKILISGRQRAAGDDKIMGYLLLRAIGRTAD